MNLSGFGGIFKMLVLEVECLESVYSERYNKDGDKA